MLKSSIDLLGGVREFHGVWGKISGYRHLGVYEILGRSPMHRKTYLDLACGGSYLYK